MPCRVWRRTYLWRKHIEVLELGIGAMDKSNFFESLGLSKRALASVKKLGYTTPTPIQSSAIPEILAGSDLIAAAETGTGKTAAFLLPLLDNLIPIKKRKRAPRVLIVSPTRELAEQISKISFTISKCCNLFTVCLFGGKPYGPQIQALKQGCDIVVATPGRLCDLMDKGVIDMSHIEAFVLDEADRMLDMGFLPDIKKIVNAIPVDRQTLLFSATIDEGIKKNFDDLLRNPKTIQIATQGQTAKLVEQYIMPVSQKDKPELLKCLLDEKGRNKVIVFVRTKAKVDGVARSLKQAGYDVAHIHSNRTQGQRKAALADFKKGKANVLVATDVLARGIDIPSVEYVVNYDLPDMAEDYIHRIGRTGRAGNIGFAVSFVSSNSIKALESIKKLLSKQIPTMKISTFDTDDSILTARFRSRKGNIKGGKKSGNLKGRKSKAEYNYEGWGDIRSGKKSSKTSKNKSKRDSATKSVNRRNNAPKNKKASKRNSFNSDKNRHVSKSSKRPGYKSSGLSKGRKS